MEYRKAGECLSYGLGRELIRNEDPSDKYNLNLKAFVTFFALTGYIEKDTVVKVQEILNTESKTLSKKKNQFTQLSTLIVRDLKKHYAFSDFEQLTAVLDEVEIPSWVFETKGILMKLFPQVYLVRELIYYMVEVEGRYYFRCIHMLGAVGLLEFSHDFLEDFDTDMVSYTETNHTISTKYSEILGFNEETMTVYLKYKHTNKLYAEYHADTNQEIVHHYSCLGVLNNKFPVIEVNNSISVVAGNEIRKIKEKDFREDYEVKDKYLYVYPSYLSPTMFRPYYLMLDGSRIEITHNDAVAYVMDKIKRDTRDFRRRLFDSEESKLKNGEYKEDIVFSLDYFDSFLTVGNVLEYDKEARRYHFIIKLLAVYLPTDKDVLDYFFMLSDVSKKLSKFNSFRFMGEAIYWRLNELHLSGKLSSVIKNKDKLKEELLKDAYEEEGSGFINPLESIYDAYVGCFSITKGKIEAYTEKIENAICIGQVVVVKCMDKPGVVAYNLDSGAYEIKYNRELTKDEVQLILNAYHIVDAAYCIGIDGSGM